MISDAPNAVRDAALKEWKRLNAPPKHSLGCHGFTLMEVVFGILFSLTLGAVIVTSLITSQSFAARARLLTNARAIVQRNIDAATAIAFTSGSIPTILQTTPTSGVVCDDDGGSGSPVENIQVQQSGTNALVTGTLTRIVSNEPAVVTGTVSALVQRVTFRIDYTYLGNPYTYSITTLRSADTQ